MGLITQDMINQFQAIMEQIVDVPLNNTYQNIHQAYPIPTLIRFLKARDGNVSRAHKMLMDCLNWRLQNDIDHILAKPIVTADFYRAIRSSQLVGMSGYSKLGLPVFAVGVGLSTYDKASIQNYVQSHIQMNEYRDRVILPAATRKYGRHINMCIKVLDMTGLKLSALNQIKLLTDISTIDDLNYPEKTETYFIVNAPYIFAACWKVVKPLLQERTRKKVHVLSGCGKDELLKIMDYGSLPHFCKKEGSGSGSGSTKHYKNGSMDNCFSLDHTFHRQLCSYIEEQGRLMASANMTKHGSFHVKFPKPSHGDARIAKTIESTFRKLGSHNVLGNSFRDITIDS